MLYHVFNVFVVILFFVFFLTDDGELIILRGVDGGPREPSTGMSTASYWRASRSASESGTLVRTSEGGSRHPRLASSLE